MEYRDEIFFTKIQEITKVQEILGQAFSQGKYFFYFKFNNLKEEFPIQKKGLSHT